MFGFGKKTKVHAPCEGEVCAMSEVDDPVFADGMMGQGFALKPAGGVLEVTAPIDGTLVTVFPTGHAFALKSDKGLEVLVHVGIDTVSMKGRGFERLVEKGQSVSQGTPIVRVDFSEIEKEGFSTIIPVVFTNKKQVKDAEIHTAQAVTPADVACEVSMN
ncbi:PTS glucose transporter subunit IIA [Corynebacterium sp. TAE3-ERU30]|uniref:PTS sugar transporter subunit IIA n=1 Tax=Corynebacterium sp. TAE3-ERU30 TaxID=2849496 RepID=UPI001C453D15|nr:PTS glucose transporter subunit IIA [Corynebacterium sp. TAE3-ERU30]MBV7282234.1 PTS glucose transporter subunit IIA [Corynebacterium sp. TAE3-ERU30]